MSTGMKQNFCILQMIWGGFHVERHGVFLCYQGMLFVIPCGFRLARFAPTETLLRFDAYRRRAAIQEF